MDVVILVYIKVKSASYYFILKITIFVYLFNKKFVKAESKEIKRQHINMEISSLI